MTYVLICMRLAEMAVVHPSQDNSRRCSRCNEPVGIYPSGMARLQRDPAMLIECARCAYETRDDIVEMQPAARTREEFEAERRDSRPVHEA